MAYLNEKGYKHDIAISYARIDNEPFANEQDRWVNVFDLKLQRSLLGLLGVRTLSVWRDREITPNEYFNQTLKEVFRSCGVFVACLSNAYIKSKYCREEIRYFYGKIQEKNDPFGLLINNKSRLFNCRLYNIPIDQWPEPLAGREGYKFFDDDGLPLRTSSIQFDDEIDRLALDIYHLLTWMYSQNIRKEIFVANSPRTVEGYREELEEMLKLKARLQPDIELPPVEKQHLLEVNRILKDACSSIHLFGCNIGEDTKNDKFIGSNRQYYLFQAEAALDTSTPQLIWYPKSSAPKIIEAEKEFLQHLDTLQIQKPLRIIPGSPANICHEVVDWVEAFLNTKKENTYWLIDAKPDEIVEKDEIKDQLSQLHQPVLNYQPSDDIVEALKSCSRYIIIIKNSPVRSVTKLMEVMSKLLTDIKGDHKIGVYIASGGKKLGEDHIEFLKDCEEEADGEDEQKKIFIYDENGNGFTKINTIHDFINRLL